MELLTTILSHEQAVAGLAALVGALALLAGAWVRARATRYLTPKDLVRLQRAAETAVEAQMPLPAKPNDERKRLAHLSAVDQIRRTAGRAARKAGKGLLDALIFGAVKAAKGWRP